MSNNTVSFRIRLNVDGKPQLVEATAAIDDLHQAVTTVKTASRQLTDKINGWGFAFQNVQNAVDGLTSSLNALTDESRSFVGAMVANTIVKKRVGL